MSTDYLKGVYTKLIKTKIIDGEFIATFEKDGNRFAWKGEKIKELLESSNINFEDDVFIIIGHEDEEKKIPFINVIKDIPENNIQILKAKAKANGIKSKPNNKPSNFDVEFKLIPPKSEIEKPILEIKEVENEKEDIEKKKSSQIEIERIEGENEILRRKAEEDRKTNVLHIRITEADKIYLNELAIAAGKKLSQYVRELMEELIERRRKHIAEDEKIRLQIRYIGNNINQIAKKMHQTGIVPEGTKNVLDELNNFYKSHFGDRWDS